MESMDLELEQRVWQRVAGEELPPEQTDTLRMLMQRAEEAAADYRRMALESSGHSREVLNALYRDARRDAGILAGMIRLEGGPVWKSQPARLSRKPSLAAACRRCSQTCRDYTDMSLHPDHGCVFRRMADAEAGHLAALLELAGS